VSTSAEILRGLPYFADLDDDLLEAVCAKTEQAEVAKGTVIIEEGTHSEEMYVIVEGLLKVTKQSGDREVELARLGAGEVVGEIALLDNAPRTATVSTETDTLLVRVPVSAFEMLLGNPDVVRRMFRTVTSRLRGIETSLRHEERMAALGRMAAQLMHELNNPAAAVGRSTGQLGEVSTRLDLVASELAGRLMEGVNLAAPGADDALSPLNRSEREDDLAAALEDMGVDEAWEVAPDMVSAGWTTASLADALGSADDDVRGVLALWIGLRATASQLIAEVSVGASRISELVRIVKEYSFLDQAPVQDVDVAKGLRDTLVLLKHKLHDIDIVLDIADDLPVVEAPGRDLNQIWTNLIDNATDAMTDGGTLTITASGDQGGIVVTVSDTGTGIPTDIIDNVFDPFFTTKEPGKGTGLGLHTVYTIVNRIEGDIDVESTSDGTTFTVRIPGG